MDLQIRLTHRLRLMGAGNPRLGVRTKNMAWPVRILLLVAGLITGIFIAKDSPQFDLVAAMVGIMLIVLFVFVVAFWPTAWSGAINQIWKSLRIRVHAK